MARSVKVHVLDHVSLVSNKLETGLWFLSAGLNAVELDRRKDHDLKFSETSEESSLSLLPPPPSNGRHSVDILAN